MPETTKSTSSSNTISPSSSSTDVLDEFRESARMGQHAAAEAWRQFNKVLDEAIPEAIHPLRAKVVDAAISLADTLAAAQYQFHRNLIRTTEGALTRTDGKEKDND
ncbi:hypothetical protein [Mycolicibacterium aubagnense]|uniref:hypothetical protein n=1 Tax=Mycolicibacterium aubagnense TaxID=319707 RepID=UPI001476B90F|nr:hypothetical protein [Mycolicibacterium aubagnense]WGI35102.1 hypothetical protein QDT91_12595 [Mycolicibacterium aubagnense]